MAHDQQIQSRPTHQRGPLRAIPLLAAAIIAAAALAPPSPASAAASDHPVTERVTVGATGGQIAGGGGGTMAISGDGRWVAYVSKGAGPIAGFSPTHFNVYRYDRATGATVLVTPPMAGGGSEANADTLEPAISNNGRFVSFETNASNLTVGDTNAKMDVYRRDVVLGTTQLISRVPGGGAVGNLDSANPSMSADGSRITFQSAATNFISADTNAQYDTFVWSSPAQLIRLANAGGGAASNGSTIYPVISADGSTVAVQSSSSNLPVGGTGSGSYDIYTQPAGGGAITRINVKATGSGAPNDGGYTPEISGDGTKVAFNSQATNQVAGDTNAKRDVFLRDTVAGTTIRVSTNAFGGQLADGADVSGISSDGQVVAFRTTDKDVTILPNPSQHWHIFTRATNGFITPIDVRDADGAYGNSNAFDGSLSATGRFVAFGSDATDLVRNDTNGIGDAFVRDRQATSQPFASWSALVAQQYLDFTGGPTTAGNANEQAARLANGETTVGRFLVDMAHAPAWAAKRGPVIRLYWSFFLRAPDKGGLAYWLGKSQNGMNLPTMAGKFAASNEFKNTYGPLSNTDFVNLVYGNVLQRKADAAGVAHWVKKLETGLTRGGMMAQFSESSEGKRVMSPYVDVLLLHLGMLRSLPTTGQFGSETLAVANGVSPISEIADNLRLTSAYTTRINS